MQTLGHITDDVSNLQVYMIFITFFANKKWRKTFNQIKTDHSSDYRRRGYRGIVSNSHETYSMTYF